ncbi:hypothetical protein EDD99_4173 [Streptomyces sp. 846.5]|nr:hypothetical protein EDD99_4173 [Streptomyces sp. 846.5]
MTPGSWAAGVRRVEGGAGNTSVVGRGPGTASRWWSRSFLHGGCLGVRACGVAHASVQGAKGGCGPAGCATLPCGVRDPAGCAGSGAGRSLVRVWAQGAALACPCQCQCQDWSGHGLLGHVSARSAGGQGGLDRVARLAVRAGKLSPGGALVAEARIQAGVVDRAVLDIGERLDPGQPQLPGVAWSSPADGTPAPCHRQGQARRCRAAHTPLHEQRGPGARPAGTAQLFAPVHRARPPPRPPIPHRSCR